MLSICNYSIPKDLLIMQSALILFSGLPKSEIQEKRNKMLFAFDAQSVYLFTFFLSAKKKQNHDIGERAD